MSEPEGFVGRWSRRKQEATKEANDEAAANEVSLDQPQTEAQAPEKAEPEFDVSTLPPIETITASTDIRAFLSAGVPAHLTRAALRAAWTSDPAIRDYIGLSEYSWDFNAPGSMHGFGPLDPSLDVDKMVADMFGQVKEVAREADRLLGEVPESASAPTRLSETPSIRAGKNQTEREELPVEAEAVGDKTARAEIAPQTTGQPDELEDEPVEPLGRRHGSALPT